MHGVQRMHVRWIIVLGKTDRRSHSGHLCVSPPEDTSAYTKSSPEVLGLCIPYQRVANGIAMDLGHCQGSRQRELYQHASEMAAVRAM